MFHEEHRGVVAQSDIGELQTLSARGRLEPTASRRVGYTGRVLSLAEAAAAAPPGPGIYCFLDARSELVYVGKAGNLRRRLQQHAKSVGDSARGRDALKRDLVADVRWEAWPDEEAAAAREADLIVAFAPVLNASIATEGRWVYIEATPDDDSGTVRFRLTQASEHHTGRRYGCFAHIGIGVSSRRAIACSEGYTAMLRLLWAAGEPDERAEYPRSIAGVSPPADVSVPFDRAQAPALHRLLSGTGSTLLDNLLERTEARRPSVMLPALRRDRESATAFFDHGPAALRDLRLRHGRPVGPLSRDTIRALLADELRASIGDFELPSLVDPTDGLLGRRAGRVHATRADRSARRERG